MKSPWSPFVLLAVWGAPGRLGHAKELTSRDDNQGGDQENNQMEKLKETPGDKSDDKSDDQSSSNKSNDASGGNKDTQTLNTVPSTESFVRRASSSVAVIGDYLYIDGGEITEQVNGSSPADSPVYKVGTTWSIDLTQSWTNETVKFQSIPKQSPTLSQQTHWVDTSTQSLYTWGGFTADDGAPPDQQLWRLAADGKGGGSWSQVTQRDFLSFSKIKGTFDTAFTQSQDVGYSFGGVATRSSDGSVNKDLPGYATPGLVSYNFRTGEWGNSSTSSYGGYGTSLNARAEYVPFGPNGLLVFLGGAETPVDATNDTIVEVNWNTITMVDPVTNQWYKQKTSGTKPPTIESHCTVGVQGPNGTYEIFMYGGVSDQIRGTSSEVYVLSLPGFTFFAGPQDAPSRSGHQCAVVGKGQRQMLSYGGVDGDNRTYTAPMTADPWTYGIGVLDMTELQWTDSYNPDAPGYDSPAQVKQWYDAGNLQQVNWDSEAVKSLFTKTAAHVPTAPTVAPTSPATSKSSTGAVVGGVVGGVVAIALIAIIAFFLIKRRRRAHTRPDTAQSRRYLATPTPNYPEEAPVKYKPEPLPKDYNYNDPRYYYSPKSVHSFASPYSPSLAPTAITAVEPQELFHSGGWRCELPAHQDGIQPVQSVELPCIRPRCSELQGTNTQIAHELPVPVETFRMELPDRKYSR
ncbi:hypothetical protein F4861DRAFT_542628 [Xylaria intraflava]|nr:hypothetical protein F4861DRAFT_542628 [Xylaria intraflava]